MKSRIVKISIGITLMICLPFMGSFSQNEKQMEGDISATYTYSSKTCQYKVYKAQARSVVECYDWSFVGTVTKNSSVSVSLYPGESVIIRIMKGASGACNYKQLKRTDHVSLPANATRSSLVKRELHDWTCK